MTIKPKVLHPTPNIDRVQSIRDDIGLSKTFPSSYYRRQASYSDDFATAARLKDIEGRLADEIQAVERLIAASKPAFRH